MSGYTPWHAGRAETVHTIGNGGAACCYFIHCLRGTGVHILDWGSPFCLSGPTPKLVVYFHRQLAFDAAAHFGAPLPPPPRHVHHRNGSKIDNSLANLEILNAAAHHCLHPPPPNHGPKRVMAQPQNQGVQKEAKKHMISFLYQIQPSIKKC